MGLLDKLRQASNSLRRLRVSRGPDSYSQYKGKREFERKRADREREHAEDFAEREREKAEREREHQERYARDREATIAHERSERADEAEPDR